MILRGNKKKDACLIKKIEGRFNFALDIRKQKPVKEIRFQPSDRIGVLMQCVKAVLLKYLCIGV